MKWITRERPKIDRIACPWLIKNFVDEQAEFIFVPKDKVFERAEELGAIPYDLPGAEYTHEGELKDEYEQLSIGMKLYDALYSWAKYVHDERHAWDPGLR